MKLTLINKCTMQNKKNQTGTISQNSESIFSQCFLSEFFIKIPHKLIGLLSRVIILKMNLHIEINNRRLIIKQL